MEWSNFASLMFISVVLLLCFDSNNAFAAVDSFDHDNASPEDILKYNRFVFEDERNQEAISSCEEICGNNTGVTCKGDLKNEKNIECTCVDKNAEFIVDGKFCKINLCKKTCGRNPGVICKVDLTKGMDIQCACTDEKADFIENGKYCKVNLCKKPCGSNPGVTCKGDLTNGRNIECTCTDENAEFIEDGRICKFNLCKKKCGSNPGILCKGNLTDEVTIKCACRNQYADFIETGKLCKIDLCRYKCGGKPGVICQGDLTNVTSIECVCTDEDAEFLENEKFCKLPCNSTLEEPCENGGKCEGSGEKKFCSCKKGTSGHFCETVDDCQELNDEICGNVSVCYYDVKLEEAYCGCLNESLKFDLGTDACRRTCDRSKKECQNGGLCSSSWHNYFCSCNKGSSGDFCEDVSGCKDVCGTEAECTFDGFRETSCRCKDPNKAFAARTKTCVAIDGCILKTLNNQCNKRHETCLSGECQCEKGYKYTEKKDACVENKCARCPKDSVCELELDDVHCKCPDGYFDGIKCMKYNKCPLGVSKCQHKCNTVTRNCTCEKGFELSPDGHSCELTDNSLSCSLPCDPGSCIKKDWKERCVCPPGTHVFKKDKCIDICTASNGTAPEGLMCPTSECESDGSHGIRCKCENPYDQADDGVHCKRKEMCKEQVALAVCGRKKSALCQEVLTGSKGYKCVCEVGFEEDVKGICRNMCDLEVYMGRCGKNNAACELNENYEPECKCPPLLRKATENGPCNEIADVSYLGKLTFLRSFYEASTSDRARGKLFDSVKLKKDLKESMKYVYGDEFSDMKILQCQISGIRLVCTVELQLKNILTHRNSITNLTFCHQLNDEFCLVQPKLVLKRKIILFERTEPCEGLVKNYLCGELTKCTSLNRKNFQCTCKKGFKAIGVYNPVRRNDTFVEKCTDIDECKLSRSCPASTTCLNTYGSYECVCKDGFRKKFENSDPKKDGCIAFCNPNPCKNGGECVKNEKLGYSCKCKPTHTGLYCDTPVSLARVESNKNTAAIVGGVLGALLFVLLIVAILVYAKLNKTKNSGNAYASQRPGGALSEIPQHSRTQQHQNLGFVADPRAHGGP